MVKEEAAPNYLEDLQRLKAEFENYKKREVKKQREKIQLLKCQLLRKLLPVVDSFEEALKMGKENPEATLKGLWLTYEKLLQVLEEEGLRRIFAVGERFEPSRHEAVAVEEVEEEERDGLVLEELQKGYLFKESLLRPSRVKVGKLGDGGNFPSSKQLHG